MRNPKLDERTKNALDEIKYGDRVQFYDCFEADVYKDKVFYVKSENPIIWHSKYGSHVLVELKGLGQFPIGKLKRVYEEPKKSDKEIREGARCCFVKPLPNCAECPYCEIAECAAQLDSDVADLLRRLDNYQKLKGGVKCVKSS